MAKNPDPQNEKAKSSKGEQANESETNSPMQPSDAAIKAGSEKSIQNLQDGAKQQAAQKALQAQQEATPVEAQKILTIREIEGVPHRVTTNEDGTEETAEFAPSQAEAYARYQTIEWESEGEKKDAELISRYAFGEGKEAFEAELLASSEENQKKLFKIAKKLDMGEVVNAKLVRQLSKAEENEETEETED